MSSLGELLVTLGVDTSQLQKGRKQVQNFGKDADASFNKAEKSASSLASTVKRVVIAFGGLYTVKRIFSSVIDASIAQEQALMRVETVLKSTGGVSGKTAQELEKTAGAFQKITTYSDETIMELQAMLLTFKDIKGDTFDEATKAAMNLSVAMNQGLKESAIQLGKALNDPILGLTALRRVGIQFTKEQEEMIKGLVEAGDKMAAQKIILAELESQFGGMARAMRETLGGAIDGLKNAWGDLFEMNKRENFSELRLKIEALTQVISSDKFQRGADIFFGAIVEGAMKAMEAIVFLAENIEVLINMIKGIAIAWASLKITAIIQSIIAFTTAIKGTQAALTLFLIPYLKIIAVGAVFVGSVYAVIRVLGNLTDKTKWATEAQKELNRATMSYIGTRKLLDGISDAGKLRTPGQYDETDWRNASLQAQYAKEKKVDSIPTILPPVEATKQRGDALADALKRYRNGIAELSLSAADYQRYQLDQWFAEEAKAIGKIPPELQKLYDLKKAVIALEEYNNSLGRKTDEIVNGLQAEAQMLRMTEAAQRAMNLAVDAGIEIGSVYYNQILEQVEAIETLKRAMELSDQIERIREGLFTQEEIIRTSYQRQIDIVQQAVDAQVIAVEEGTLLTAQLYRQMGRELDAISEETFNQKMAQAFEGWANNFSSQLNDMLWKADVTFEDIAVSFAKMVTQMMIQLLIIQPLMGWMTGMFGLAKGGVIANGRLTPFARGGIVTGPTVFPMANGVGLMGEAGPEAIMPLKRDSSGRLGVEASGMGTSQPVIINLLDKADLERVTYEAMTKYPGASIVVNHILRGQSERSSFAFRGTKR